MTLPEGLLWQILRGRPGGLKFRRQHPVGRWIVDFFCPATRLVVEIDGELRLMSKPNIRFAGQITGCEGYVESAAVGILAARFAAIELRGDRLAPPPVETALGALLGHITGGANAETFQPMNVNFGLMPPPEGRAKKADRKKAYTDRARAAFAGWMESIRVAEPA